jgi:hypothetical protein
MSPDWKQPFVLIFEWGLFILGWSIVGFLSLMMIAFMYAIVRTTFMVVTGRIKKAVETTTKPSPTLPQGPGGSLDDNPPKI